MMLYAHALHFICIFNYVSCIIDMCFNARTLCGGRFGLGWAHDVFFCCTSHDHALFMRTYLFISSLVHSVDWCFSVSLSLSLSLSQIVCAWHPSIKLLRPRTFSIPGHLLLIPYFSMSGFVIRRSVRTFRRTSPNVAFIRNAMLPYRTTLILLFWLSYVIRVGNLFVRYLWVIPSWSYKSFTPICTVLIIPYLVSLLLFEVLI